MSSLPLGVEDRHGQAPPARRLARVPGDWLVTEVGTWLAPGGSWLLLGTRHWLAPGSWLLAPGSWLLGETVDGCRGAE